MKILEYTFKFLLISSLALALVACDGENVSAQNESEGGSIKASNFEMSPVTLESLTEDALVNNSSFAQYNLGKVYLNGGYDVERDSAKAAEFFLMAAKQRDIASMRELAKLYWSGNGVEQSDEIAQAWSDLADELVPYEDVLAEIGGKYTLEITQNGQTYEFNVKELSDIPALETLAYEHDNEAAQFRLGSLYYTGKLVERDYGKAFELISKAADQGDWDAKVFLAAFYYEGTGISSDLQKAAGLAKEAFPTLDGNILRMLAIFYAQGVTVQRDISKALDYFRYSAVLEDAESQLKLANAYYLGSGIKRDLFKAAEWMERAAKNGLPAAQRILGGFYLKGEGVTKDETKARSWILQSAENGDVDAQYLSGYLILQSQPTAAEVREAYIWLKKAACHAHSGAQFILATSEFDIPVKEFPIRERLTWYLIYELGLKPDDPDLENYRKGKEKLFLGRLSNREINQAESDSRNPAAFYASVCKE